MPFSSTADNSILALLFNATTWTFIAQNNATTPDTTIAWSLQTADPTAAGNMSSNEITYTSYARASTNRASGAGGMTVTANSCSPQANVSFPAGTGGSGTASFFCVGRPGGGATAIHMSGTVSPNIVCGNGVTPILTTATTLTLS